MAHTRVHVLTPLSSGSLNLHCNFHQIVAEQNVVQQRGVDPKPGEQTEPLLTLHTVNALKVQSPQTDQNALNSLFHNRSKCISLTFSSLRFQSPPARPDSEQ